ncbi:lipase family protein [Arthrobacter roseus]|uniref:lipase family protein n=1 Tax=Arthrobacter roseus TaxID=136274 RepID=UPI001963DE12|nr:lipase family protein [Arthrobacter roseus]MBM7847390.1 putative esterase [Arthrobacter roseus]
MKNSYSKLAITFSVAAALAVGTGLPAQAVQNVPAPGLQAEPAVPPFYQTPEALPANNGALIRHEPSVFYLDPLKALKAPATVERIMYRSTDSQGQPMAVTGTVLVPKTTWTGKGERPMVSYAVGTQGLGDQCAPSRKLAAGQEYEGIFIKGLLSRGYAVVVTDYEGLGTEGVHTYLNRASQGQAVLDAARAAQQLGTPGLPTNGPIALAGYSQGGGASASAAELAPAYAPELDLRGAYVGAPPSDLSNVGAYIDGGLYTGFLLYALNGIASGYDLDMTSYLNENGQATLAANQRSCTIEGIADHAFLNTATLTTSGKKLSTTVQVEPLKSILKEQLLANGRKPSVPVLLSQSLLDDAIPYAQARDVAERWCDQGATVAMDTTAGPTHIGGYVAAIPRAFVFLQARFAGHRPVSSCWRL